MNAPTSKRQNDRRQNNEKLFCRPPFCLYYSFATAPEIDILLIPSTETSMTTDLENALYLVEKIYSKEHALKTSQGLVIDWDLQKVPHFVAK